MAGGLGERVEGNLDSATVLILFVEVVIISIYLISLTLVVVRRAKKLFELHNRKYYLGVVFYIASKLVLCAILVLRIIIGIPEEWKNMEANFVEVIAKTAITLADFSIIILFLVALQTYFALYFSIFTDPASKKQSKVLSRVLKGVQLVVLLVFIIPLIVYDVDQIGFKAVNYISIGLNSTMIISFVVTFFYLNFKMTGIMLEPRLNETIRRLYKTQVIILISRALMIAFEVLVAVYVEDSFEKFLDDWADSAKVNIYIILGGVFVLSILLMLCGEGLPIMYSLRGAVVEALNYKPPAQTFPESIFTDHIQDLQESMLEKVGAEDEEGEHRHASLATFRNIQDLELEKQDAIWLCKRGSFEGRDYIIRISKYEISSYIFEDIENELTLWSQLAIRSQSKLSYFTENGIIHLVERYYASSLDQRAAVANTDWELLTISLQVAQAVEHFHEAELVHGCLSPNHIFFEGSEVLINGHGLHSMKKYLSLITGYTNKNIYTAVEQLRERNNVIIKPTKEADIYSFGVIFYEIVTGNRQYRQLPLREVAAKFAEDNFRPKLPENVRFEIKNLIRKCWHERPQKRPSISEVISTLKQLI